MLNRESLMQLLSQLESWKEKESVLVVTLLSMDGSFKVFDKGNLSVIPEGEDRFRLESASRKTVLVVNISSISAVSQIAPDQIKIEHFIKGGPKAANFLFISMPTGLLIIFDVVQTGDLENIETVH